MPKFDFTLNIGHLLQVLTLAGFGGMVIIQQGTRLEVLAEQQRAMDYRVTAVQETLQRQVDQTNHRLVTVEERTNKELQIIRQVVIDINRKVQ